MTAKKIHKHQFNARTPAAAGPICKNSRSIIKLPINSILDAANKFQEGLINTTLSDTSLKGHRYCSSIHSTRQTQFSNSNGNRRRL